MPTLGFDVRGTQPGFKAHYGRGTGRYATELFSELLKLTDSEFRLLPLSQEMLAASGWQRSLLSLLPFGKQTAETQLFLPQRLENLPVDMLHFMAHGDATSRCRKPYIVTVLDLIPLRFPELYRADKTNLRFRFARYLEDQAIRQASGILAISEATKRDVVELLGVKADKIVVTPLGVTQSQQPREASAATWIEYGQATRKRYGLADLRPLLLYVGGIDPRKNIIFMLRVFAELLGKFSGAERPQLLLVGRHERDDQYPLVLAEIKQLGIEADVRLLGYVPDEEISDLYRAAHLKIFPSLYEGFGLPVLEAMSFGLPVVAGRNSSIPEVAGDAALLLDCELRGGAIPAETSGQWVREVELLLRSNSKMDEFAESGIKRARQFTWKRTAELTKAAYSDFSRCVSKR